MLSAVLSVVGLFAGMLALLEFGRKCGLRDYAQNPEHSGKGLGPLVGALFGLMGLLIAFTFSGAGARFDARRHLIVEETNAIGTAYLRLSLLPVDSQPALRANFRQYLDSRIDFYRNLPDDSVAAQAAKDRSEKLQDEIWNQAVQATRLVGAEANANAVTSLVIQSLNQMIDLTATRMVALQIHPPTVVYLMLALVVLACSMLAGYETAARKTRSWIHVLGFAVIVSGSILLILDYEYPRFGFIRVDATDHVLTDLRHTMR